MLRKLLWVPAIATFVSAVPAQSLQEKYRLPNGLTVILREDHTVPIATVNLWYKVGSKDEPEHRSGFAHLFEHLMFMGTKRVPTGQFDKIMEGGGGDNNASTAEDRTNFYSEGPSNLLPTLLWLDADRMQDLGNAMDQHKLDLQRDVVKNERRERTENTPYGKAYELVNSLMFPKGHPYDHSTIGSMADLDAATVKDVQDFFATYYVPNNASLVVAGDFDPKTVKGLIAQYFGTLPRQNDPVHRIAVPVQLGGVKRMTMIDKVQFPKTVMVWHSPAAYKPGDAEMSLAGAVLSDGLTSRLYQRLVVRDKLASDVNANQDSKLLGSLFTIDATAAEGVSLDRLEAAIDDTLKQFEKEGPTKEELQRVVAKIQTGMVSGLQSIQAVADKLNEFEFYLGTPNAFDQVLAAYRQATPESTKTVARQTINLSSRLILRIVPQAPESTTKVDPRGTKPTVTAEKGFTSPKPTQFTLSNGVKVYYWNRPALPLMALETRFAAGGAVDAPGKLGAAELTSRMLEQGSGSLNAGDFHDALDQLGATFSTSSGQLNSTVGLSVLSPNFKKALGLYADAIIQPHFNSADFLRSRRVTIAELQQQSDDPDAVARKVSLREFFGATNLYGRYASPKTVGSLTVPDLKADHRQIYDAANASIFVAGSLKLEEVRADLEKVFAGWKPRHKMVPPPIHVTPGDQLKVFVVDKPGAVQTVVRFMMPAPVFASPDRQALLSLNTILGGSFTSRLNQNIRETHGYAYGAGSNFIFNQNVGYVIATSAVRTDVTGAAITEFLSEFKKIRAGDITDEEARKAASTRRSEIVGSLATLPSLIGLAQTYDANGRPFTDVDLDVRRLMGLKTSDLNTVASGALPLEHGVLVLVGDKAAILKQLAGLDLPPAVEVKAD